MSMAVGVFIISLCSNENQISVFSTLIVFPSSMISGCLWPIEIMSDNLQKLSYIFPQRYIYILLEKFSIVLNCLNNALRVAGPTP